MLTQQHIASGQIVTVSFYQQVMGLPCFTRFFIWLVMSYRSMISKTSANGTVKHQVIQKLIGLMVLKRQQDHLDKGLPMQSALIAGTLYAFVVAMITYYAG